MTDEARSEALSEAERITCNRCGWTCPASEATFPNCGFCGEPYEARPVVWVRCKLCNWNYAEGAAHQCRPAGAER